MNSFNTNHESFYFHHIGSITPNLGISEKIFSNFGFVFNNDRFFDPIQEVNLSFGKNNMGVLLELVEPLKNSKIENLLQRNGPGPYHLCFEVNSIMEQEKKLNKRGFICVAKPKKAIAFENRHVAFYYSTNDGLIELLEK
tara:strand:+ start:491 stop:910 length:420 start_codon:yes stop_codon:yes gene_type:complete